MTDRSSLNDAAVIALHGLRRSAGLTLDEVAARSGIPRVSVQRYLSGGRSMTIETFETLCRVMGSDCYAVLTVAERLRDEHSE